MSKNKRQGINDKQMAKPIEYGKQSLYRWMNGWMQECGGDGGDGGGFHSH